MKKIQMCLFFLLLLHLVSYSLSQELKNKNVISNDLKEEQNFSRISKMESSLETDTDVTADTKYTIKYDKSDVFDKINSGIQEYKEKCYNYVGKVQFVTSIDPNNLIIQTSPILVKLNKDEIKLLLQDDDSFLLFNKSTDFIKSIEPLIPSQKDFPCIEIKIEEVTPTKLIKIITLKLCGKDIKQISKLKESWSEYKNDCTYRDPLLVEDFTELNNLVGGASSSKDKKDIFDTVAYENPKKEKSPREIQKELLKGKISIIKNKLLEKKFSEKELCRQEKLKAMDEKLEKEEEERIKKLNNPVKGPETPKLSLDNNEALQSLNKIESQLNSQLSTVKSALKST